MDFSKNITTQLKYTILNFIKRRIENERRKKEFKRKKKRFFEKT